MDASTLHNLTAIDNTSFQLGAHLPVPNMGVLPVNAYLIKAVYPTLIDTGLASTEQDLIDSLEQQIDFTDLRYLWLTHMDADHIGNLKAVLRAAPQATVVTSFLGAGKMGLWGIEHPRIQIIADGGTLDLGDRELLAVAPPCYDAPETLGCFDSKSRALYSADCFGALLQAPAESADALHPAELMEGLITWAEVDAPWLRSIPYTTLKRHCQHLLEMEPSWILSSHLPPANQCSSTLIEGLLMCSAQ